MSPQSGRTAPRRRSRGWAAGRPWRTAIGDGRAWVPPGIRTSRGERNTATGEAQRTRWPYDRPGPDRSTVTGNRGSVRIATLPRREKSLLSQDAGAVEHRSAIVGGTLERRVDTRIVVEQRGVGEVVGELGGDPGQELVGRSDVGQLDELI